MNRRKIFIILLATILASSAAPAFSHDGAFRNEIVQPDEAPLVIPVEDRRFVRILNFLQEGSSATRGFLSVTRGGRTASILSATTAGNEAEVQKDLIIVGPATITVHPALDGKLFLSYRRGRNNG